MYRTRSGPDSPSTAHCATVVGNREELSGKCWIHGMSADGYGEGTMFKKALLIVTATLIATATTLVLSVTPAQTGARYDPLFAVETLEKRVSNLENALTAARKPGLPGPPGVKGLNSLIKITALEKGDTDCPAGGIKLEAGLDDNRSGTLDTPQEVDDTNFVCKG